jgi:hypothetical protein
VKGQGFSKYYSTKLPEVVADFMDDFEIELNKTYPVKEINSYFKSIGGADGMGDLGKNDYKLVRVKISEIQNKDRVSRADITGVSDKSIDLPEIESEMIELPIILKNKDGKLKIADGFHRLFLKQENGDKYINAFIPEEAIITRSQLKAEWDKN